MDKYEMRVQGDEKYESIIPVDNKVSSEEQKKEQNI